MTHLQKIFSKSVPPLLNTETIPEKHSCIKIIYERQSQPAKVMVKEIEIKIQGVRRELLKSLMFSIYL